MRCSAINEYGVRGGNQPHVCARRTTALAWLRLNTGIRVKVFLCKKHAEGFLA
jgi:hypothetical protein